MHWRTYDRIHGAYEAAEARSLLGRMAGYVRRLGRPPGWLKTHPSAFAESNGHAPLPSPYESSWRDACAPMIDPPPKQTRPPWAAAQRRSRERR